MSCSRNQGISAGWVDAYHFLLDGQWVDVTDVAAGEYVLEVEVNAERLFEEADYTNNSAAVAIRVPRRPGRQASLHPDRPGQAPHRVP